MDTRTVPYDWLGIVVSLAGVVVTLLLYWREHQPLPLQWSSQLFYPVGAYEATGIELDGRCSPVNLYAFPTVDNPVSRQTDSPGTNLSLYRY